MPRTRWSRASTSTLVSAARLGRGIRLGTGARLPSRRGGGLGGRTLGALGLGCLGLPGLSLAVPGLRAAGPALALRRGAALRQRLGQRGGENLLFVTARRSSLERSLGSGQALEALPVAGHLEQLAHRVGRLRADRQPVLRPVRIDLDQRGIRLRVVLPDLLDGTAISLGAGIGDDDPVVGLADLAHAL